jgi:hypothetical protein
VQAAAAGVRRASIATRGQLSGYLFSKAARRIWCNVVMGVNPRRLRAAMGDPDPEANTSNRYQTGASADPAIQHINLPDRYPGSVGNWCATYPLTRGSRRLIDDRQMRAARLRSCQI